MGPEEGRPTARELLDDPFLGRRVGKTDSNKALPVHRARSSDQGDFHSAPGSETSESGVPAHSHGSNHIPESHHNDSHRWVTWIVWAHRAHGTSLSSTVLLRSIGLEA